MRLMEQAIQLEIDGEQYYHQQAKLNQGTPLETVFILLAKAEIKHLELLHQMDRGSYPSMDGDPSKEARDLFGTLGEFRVDPGYIADQLEVYRAAKEIELKSIELYQSMHKSATQAEDKKLLLFLVKQEQSHYDLFENLETLLERPTSWVESAEFGNREEY